MNNLDVIQLLIEARPCPHFNNRTTMEEGMVFCQDCRRTLSLKEWRLDRENVNRHDEAIAFMRSKTTRRVSPQDRIVRALCKVPPDTRGMVLADVAKGLYEQNQSFIASLFTQAAAQHSFGLAITKMVGPQPQRPD